MIYSKKLNTFQPFLKKKTRQGNGQNSKPNHGRKQKRGQGK